MAVDAGRPRKRLLLRLDDGSLIGRAEDLGGEQGNEGVVHITMDQAAQLGRVSDKEVARLQSILERLRAAHGLPAAATPNVPPSKKARMDSAQLYTAPSTDPVHGAWQAKCREVFNAVLKHLSIHKSAFYDPVNPQVLKDYYEVIKEPLFLVDIDERLKNSQYTGPQDFLNDVRHHFNNVRLYNPEGDPYRKIGNKAEEFFEQQWAGTGFSQERTRRVTAGLAAPKFDPEKFEAPVKPKAARSQQGGSAKRGRMDGQHLGHEVTSGGRMGGMGAPMLARPSQQRIQEMGVYLSREDLPDEHSQYLMSLLPPAMLSGLETGEIELDFEALDDSTLVRIDAWLSTLPDAQAMFMPQMGMQGMAGHQGVPGAMFTSPGNQPSVRVDSYDDEDYEEEESDDSD